MTITRYPFRDVIRNMKASPWSLTRDQIVALDSLEAHDAHVLVGQAVADQSFDLMWALRFATMDTEHLSAHLIGKQVTSEPIDAAERSLKFLRHYLAVAEAQLEARRGDEG